MSGSIHHTACPQCKEVGGLFMSAQLVAQPLGTWSLSGSQIKTPAEITPFLKCANCTYSLAGKFDGEFHATFQPKGEVSGTTR